MCFIRGFFLFFFFLSIFLSPIFLSFSFFFLFFSFPPIQLMQCNSWEGKYGLSGRKSVTPPPLRCHHSVRYLSRCWSLPTEIAPLTSVGQLKCAEQGAHTSPNRGCIRPPYLHPRVKLLCRTAVTILSGLSFSLSKNTSFSVLKRTALPPHFIKLLIQRW